MDEQTLSHEGKKKLEIELDELINVKRKKVIARIQAAKEHGDLRENADYHDAREEQSFMEGRIKEIENILKNTIVSEMNSGDAVQVGSKIILVKDNKDFNFTIVGSHEGNPATGMLSCDSPLGLALLGKKISDRVEVETPVGMISYEIKKIV
jgi:transcription elongation factor GreA